MTELPDGAETTTSPASRAAGMARLNAFRSAMGRHYGQWRNHDFGPANRSNVSTLSPWISHRQVLEEEVAGAALGAHGFAACEKFLQEVCWRAYFKGWMEQRPGVWDAFVDARSRQYQQLQTNAGLRLGYETAVAGRTGIDAFDGWARELVETGYLHNHARMWFASIWIFTLKLPWELGADFFLHHLIDADAASNTLSWRWVGGLHTPGKTYLARASNIRKYTEDRFNPVGLSAEAAAISGFENPARTALRRGDDLPEGDIALLLTEADLHVETLRPPGATIKALAGLVMPGARSPAGAGGAARLFTEGAIDDALERGRALFGVSAQRLDPDFDLADQLRELAKLAQTRVILTGFAPVGWVRPAIDAARDSLSGEGIRLVCRQRDWDAAFWPHATAGFFRLKKAIPQTLASLGLPV